MKTYNKKIKEKTGLKINVKTKTKTKIKRTIPKTKIKSSLKVDVKTKIKTKKLILKTNKTETKKSSLKDNLKMKKTTNIKKITPNKHSATNAAFGPVDVEPYYFKKNEDYMNKKQLIHFRTILSQWKEQLMEDVDYTMNHMKDDASNYPDPVDRASQEEEFNLELRTRDRERKLLKKIDETLMRINDEDYGYCDDCGAEIGIRRLEARPTANQCIECKTISEIREKQIGESD